MKCRTCQQRNKKMPCAGHRAGRFRMPSALLWAFQIVLSPAYPANKKDRTPPVLPEGTVRRRYTITGQVQGVGFRYRARYAAQTLDLTGWAQNEDDGSVTLEVQGDPDKFLTLFAMIQKSDYIQITGIRQKDIPPDPWERGFSVKGY